MNPTIISCFNGEVIFWDEHPAATDLPLGTVLYHWSGEYAPVLSSVYINWLNKPSWMQLLSEDCPVELKAAALLMGAPIPK